MKQYPRIYSLSTVGLIHHNNYDYLFHPIRTDFIGESGAGKSIIADLIQLIFVGGGVFESATKSTDIREPAGLVLTQGGNTNTIGYAFLNIEMQPSKYFVIGMHLETGNKSVLPFTIQQGFNDDNITYLDTPINCEHFVKDDEIQPINELSDHMNDKGLYCKSFYHLKKYHELLYNLNILPINMAASERDLKDYAEILQALSRGRSLNTKNSESLKNFLFGKNDAKEIIEEYNAAVRDLEATIGEYGTNLQEIERVNSKQTALIHLKSHKDILEKCQKIWMDKKLLFYYQEVSNSLHEIKTISQDFIQSSQHFDILQELIREELARIRTTLPTYQSQLTKIQKELINISANNNAINKVEKLLIENNCDLDVLKRLYEENSAVSSQKQHLQIFSNKLNDRQVTNSFENIEDKTTIPSLITALDNLLTRYNNELIKQESLKKFYNLNDPKSFAYWAIQQKRAFTLQEESAILKYQALPRHKNNKSDYLPSPETFIKALKIVEEEAHGCWIDLAGIKSYITYTTQPIFNTADTNTISAYFSTHAGSLDIEIKNTKRFIEEYNAIKEIILSIPNPGESLSAYHQKEYLINYTLNHSLNIKRELFEEYLDLFKNKDAIKKAYHDLTEQENELNEIIYDHGSLERVLKNIPNVNYYPKDISIESVLQDIGAEYIIENIKTHYLNIKTNIKASFKNSHDKSAYIQKNFEEIRPKLEAGKQIEQIKAKFDSNTAFLDKAKSDYLNFYATLPETLEADQYIPDPKKEYDEYFAAEANYNANYKNVINQFIPTESYRLSAKDNFKDIAIVLLPEAFHDIILSEHTNIDVLEKINNYLTRINEKNSKLNSRKLLQIKFLLHKVDTAITEQEDKVRRIDNFLKNQDNITGGYKARLRKAPSPGYPREWMSKFKQDIDENANGLANLLSQKIDLENMMKTAFQNCGGRFGNDTTVKELLNPASYYELSFSMESASGRNNIGSTGQTYAAIALLCIARLSVMDREEGKNQRPAVRVMPIDEAQGLGSNYDLLYDIAKAFDYQILSFSIGPVGKLVDGEQYMYILHKNPQLDIPINFTPMAFIN